MMAFTLVIVFIASSGFVLGAYVFLTRRRLAREQAARRRLREPVTVSGTVRLLRDQSASAIPMLDEWLQQAPGTAAVSRAIRAAGSNVSPATLVLLGGVLATLGVFIGQTQGSLLLSVPLGVLGFALPLLYLRWRTGRRIAKFESQLPEAIDMVTNAMRAGYSFQAAMELVGQEIAAPLGTEFTQFYEEQNLGMDVRTALLALQDRVRSLDLKMFITAVLIQRETGGNLGEVLENIGAVIRGRFRIQGELKTLTAQVRLSSKILGLLPVLVVIMITLVNPDFIAPLFNETAGRIMLAGAAISQLVGFAVMWKLADIEI